MDQPQVRINPETGQPEVAVFQPLDEAQLQADAQAAEASFNQVSGEVTQLEEALKNAQATVDQIQSDLSARVQTKAESEAAYVNKSSVVAALAAERERVANDPAPEQADEAGEPAPDGEAEGDGEDAPSESVDVPVSVVA